MNDSFTRYAEACKRLDAMIERDRRLSEPRFTSFAMPVGPRRVVNVVDVESGRSAAMFFDSDAAARWMEARS